MKPDELKKLLVKPKRNKFGAVKKEFNGRIYHSVLEANYAQNLEFKKKGKQILDYIPQYKIPLFVNEILICYYVIDFRVEENNGSFTYVEVKGKETPDFKLKWKLAHALYPDYNFILIK
jgi:hypothetical protein